MIKLVVFDMAGTTIDEDNIVYKTLQKAINNHGYTCSLEQVLTLGAGKEKQQAISDILAHILPQKQQDIKEVTAVIFQDFKMLLQQAYRALEVKAYPETEAVFSALKQKGIKVVLNTGYDRKTACFLLEKLQWKKNIHFDALLTADDVVNGRPAPDMIEKAMQIFSIDNPKEVVKIGDSVVDILEGKAANCGTTIGVTTGAQSRAILEKAAPTYIYDSLTQLYDLL